MNNRPAIIVGTSIIFLSGSILFGMGATGRVDVAQGWGAFIMFLSGSWFILACIKPQSIKKTGSANVCANCGYDLRATPDRCPECGHIPVPGEQV